MQWHTKAYQYIKINKEFDTFHWVFVFKTTTKTNQRDFTIKQEKMHISSLVKNCQMTVFHQRLHVSISTV